MHIHVHVHTVIAMLCGSTMRYGKNRSSCVMKPACMHNVNTSPLCSELIADADSYFAALVRPSKKSEFSTRTIK